MLEHVTVQYTETQLRFQNYAIHTSLWKQTRVPFLPSSSNLTGSHSGSRVTRRGPKSNSFGSLSALKQTSLPGAAEFLPSSSNLTGSLLPFVPAPAAPNDISITSNRKHARGLSPFLQNIVNEGFVEVQKRKKTEKLWLKFWCILWSERMCLYRNERKDGSTKELMSPVSMINIADLESVSFGKHKGGYFEFTLIMKNSGVSVYFRCKQQAERRSWVSAIKQKIDDLQQGKTVPTNLCNGFESFDYPQGGRVNENNSCLMQ